MPNISLAITDGTVEYRPEGSEEWQAAVNGQAVRVGAHVRTLADGNAILNFIEGSQVVLKPDTQVTVEVFELVDGGPPGGSRVVKMRIVEGDIDFDIVDAPSPPNVWQFLTDGEVIAIQGE